MQLNKNVYQSFKRSVVLVILFSLLLLTGCERRPSSSFSSTVPEVAAITVQTRKVVLETELSGRTSAYRIAEIRPQVSGLILKRLFAEGSDVLAGQVLYQIDPAPFQAALGNVRAALLKSEAKLPALRSRVERYKELLADKAVSQQDYDDADAVLKQTLAEIEYWKAQVETARINLGYCRVSAPISGRIGKSNVTEGAIVAAYQPMSLSAIQQLDPIYVDVPQTTTDLLRLKRYRKEGRLRHGMNQNKVKLILEDGTAYPLEGTLQFSDVTVNPTTGSVILRVVFPNPESILLPGMFVRTVIKEGINEQALMIPQQGVSRDRKGEPFALIVNAEEKVGQRMLVLDRAIGAEWLVLSGLAPGERVIVEGIQRIRPGSAVKVVPFAKNKTLRGSKIRSQKQANGGM